MLSATTGFNAITKMLKFISVVGVSITFVSIADTAEAGYFHYHCETGYCEYPRTLSPSATHSYIAQCSFNGTQEQIGSDIRVDWSRSSDWVRCVKVSSNNNPGTRTVNCTNWGASKKHRVTLKIGCN